MIFEQVLDELFHLTPDEGKQLRNKTTGEVYENDIWFGLNQTENDFEEIDRVEEETLTEEEGQ